MAYDQAILDAFTTYETALRFDEWACTRPGPPEETSAHRGIARTIVKRSRAALYEAIDMGVAYEGPAPTTISPPAQDRAAEGSER